MKVLIFGGAGMLGHKLVQVLSGRMDVWVTFRNGTGGDQYPGLFDASRSIPHVDVSSIDAVVRAVARVQPDAVINCIGVIKQLAASRDPLLALETNSVFPHRLANICAAAGSRMVHISTDCVFSGSRGHYTETDISDAEDLYGRTKYLGEVGETGALTLRTSIIGRELRTTSGLVEWFLTQNGRAVQGWTGAVYTGVTTLVLARVIGDILEKHPRLEGLYQVASEPITKYELLQLVRDAYRRNTQIEPFDGVRIDRSLDGRRFREATGFVAPSWPDMVKEMASDPTPYDQWRKT